MFDFLMYMIIVMGLIMLAILAAMFIDGIHREKMSAKTVYHCKPECDLFVSDWEKKSYMRVIRNAYR